MEADIIVAVVAAATLAVSLAYHIMRLIFERRFREWQEAEQLRWQEEHQKALKGAIADAQQKMAESGN